MRYIFSVYVKLEIVLMLPLYAPNTIVHYQVVPKTIADKLSFRELIIEKVKLLLRVQPNFFAATFLTLEVA